MNQDEQGEQQDVPRDGLIKPLTQREAEMRSYVSQAIDARFHHVSNMSYSILLKLLERENLTVTFMGAVELSHRMALEACRIQDKFIDSDMLKLKGDFKQRWETMMRQWETTETEDWMRKNLNDLENRAEDTNQ